MPLSEYSDEHRIEGLLLKTQKDLPLLREEVQPPNEEITPSEWTWQLASITET